MGPGTQRIFIVLTGNTISTGKYENRALSETVTGRPNKLERCTFPHVYLVSPLWELAQTKTAIPDRSCPQ